MIDRRDDIQGLCEDYWYGLLSGEEEVYVEQQAARHASWREALAEAERRHDAVQDLPVVEASSQLIAKTIQGVVTADRRKRRMNRTTWMIGGGGALAAALIALSVIHIHFANLAPSPYDLNLLGQSNLLAGTHGSLRVRLTNRETNQPVADAPVTLLIHDVAGKRDAVELAEFRTDARGTGSPRFRLPDWPDGEYELQVTALPDGRKEAIEHTVTFKRDWQLMLTTDKPVYQPGQTIQIRSLALRRPDLVPVAGEEVIYTIADPKGNIIFKHRDQTSRFGITATQCPLSDELIEGAYTIKCAAGQTESSATVEIKPYVLPKFKVDVALDKTYYLPGQTIRGSVSSAYFFGKPVANAGVSIELQSDSLAIANIRIAPLTTDEDGETNFELILPDRPFENPMPLRVLVSVIDPANQKQNRTVPTLVVSNPLRIEVIPENGRLVKNVRNRVYVYTRYVDGRPAPTHVSVNGIDADLRTNDLGVTSFELSPTTDTVALTLTAVDADQLAHTKDITLQCGSSPEDFLIRTDKTTYTGGETIHVSVLAGGSEPVFIDLIKDGQTMLTQVVEMSEGRGRLDFDVPPDLFGTVRVIAYRFSADTATPLRQSLLVHIDRPEQLRITAKLDHAEYRPGGKATVSLAITDADGKPAPGAISLAAVDEAVFSVLAQRPGMTQTFFTLDRELLQPIYALYPWSPDWRFNNREQQADFERALFASAAAEQSSRRDSLLRELVDEGYIDEDYLEVLEGPYFDRSLEMLEGSGVSQETIELLQNGSGGVHSLSLASYPAKARATQERQRAGLRTVHQIWTGVAIVGGVVLLFTMLYLMSRSTAAALLMIFLLFLCVALLLPALGSARRSSLSMQAASEMRGLAQGIEILTDSARSAGASRGETELPTHSPRVRQWFPETLLWRPQLITDERGHAFLEIDLADSITTWRLSASAVTAQGRLGGTQADIRVFQPFFVDLNLPVALTRGDEIAVPVVLYNYLDKAQRVDLKLSEKPWFDLLDDAERAIELKPNEVRSISFRIRVKRAGRHKFEIAAIGRADGEGKRTVGDAVHRMIDVVPDGRRIENVASGTLQQPFTFSARVSDHAIEGGTKTILKLYPSSFSQVVEGLDNIFQRPYGCFEQTSSTTYPNVLALAYLQRTKQSVPGVEAKARQYIHLGYQRLLTFEVAGGGFDWFGNPPANRTLTAYGLMEFADMARVHDVDRNIIDRTQRWLLAQQKSNGSWQAESHQMHSDPTARRGDLGTLSTTAYIAWAMFGQESAGADLQSSARRARDFIRSWNADAITDPYVLALVCNALAAINEHAGVDADPSPYVRQLLAMKKTSADRQLVWWQRLPEARGLFYGGGRSGDIETTALAALALVKTGESPADARAALNWLVTQKDGIGTWHSTQATVLALKALLEGSGATLAGETERRFEIRVDNRIVETITVPADQGEVVHQLDLTQDILAGGETITVRELTDTGSGFQLVHRYHVAYEPDVAGAAHDPFTIDVTYDRRNLAVNESIHATARVVNNMAQSAAMVMVDLPIPAGFVVDRSAFDRMVANRTIARYQLTPRSIIVYLRDLPAAKTLKINYTLQATIPASITVQPAKIYEYYNPDRGAYGRGVALVVQ